jgi:hypothetical protein
VYTLHAELEGMRLAETFERLLAGWQEQGYQLVSCRELFASLNTADLPRHHLANGEIAGRSGILALQGAPADCPDHQGMSAEHAVQGLSINLAATGRRQ